MVLLDLQINDISFLRPLHLTDEIRGQRSKPFVIRWFRYYEYRAGSRQLVDVSDKLSSNAEIKSGISKFICLFSGVRDHLFLKTVYRNMDSL